MLNYLFSKNFIGKKYFLTYFTFFTLFILNSLAFSEKDNPSKIKPAYIHKEKFVSTKLVFDEIYNIDLTNGSYDATVELLMSWKGNTENFNTADKIIYGKQLEDLLGRMWHPQFIIGNSLAPRTTFYKTLKVRDGKLELFEKFSIKIAIDTEMPTYPFGTLDLYIDIENIAGNHSQMSLTPDDIKIGNEILGGQKHEVIKGNWIFKKAFSSTQKRKSINDKNNTSYLIAHIKIQHDHWDTVQRVIFPVFTIIIISILLNFLFPLNINRKENNYWRFYGNWALFFATPTYRFALSDMIPTNHYIGLLDALFIYALFLVTLNLFFAFAINYYFLKKNDALARKLESLIRIISPLTIIFIPFLFILF